MVVLFYVTLRHTDLPIFLYLPFPYIGVCVMVFIFWFSYDLTAAIRSSEQLLNRLRPSRANLQSLGGMMSKDEKTKILMLRARAMRILAFPIGIFANFSLAVPVNVWDQVLDLLILLLSL